jgi:transketolase
VECGEKPGIILVASGSEVGTLTDASKIVEKEKGTRCRIVSLPSMALFFEQSIEYRESVITPGIPVFGLSAGLSITLIEAVGPLGKAVGLERFGASASYKVLDDKFGFTAEKVAAGIMEYLNEYATMRAKLG